MLARAAFARDAPAAPASSTLQGRMVLCGRIAWTPTTPLNDCPLSQWSEKPATWDAATSTVIRRYSDFVWLRDALKDAVPWVVVPAQPEKQNLGRFNTDFVEIR